MSMSIYIVSSSLNIEPAREFAESMVARGYVIEREWWKDVDMARTRGWDTDAAVSDAFARRCGQQNLAAVSRSRAVVFLDSEHKSFGAGFEIGYALALGKPVFVLGEAHGRIWERMDEWVHVDGVDELDCCLRDDGIDVITKKRFAEMSPRARGYTVYMHGARPDQPHVPDESNPYPRATWEHLEWGDGQRAAVQEVQD